MSDDNMPAQPSTVQLPAVPEWAIELTKSVKSGFRAAEERFDKQDATLQTLADNDLKSTERIAKLEVRIEDLEEGRTKWSGGIKNLSQSDDGQNMQIASLAVKVDELSKSQELQLAILARLDKLASNPSIKVLLGVAAMAAASWAAARGLK